jgi:hypothetical protein
VLNYGGNLNNVTEKYVQCARSPGIQRQYHIAISKRDPANDLTDLFCTGVSKFLTFRFDRIMLLDDRLFIFLVKLLNKTNIYFDPFVISVLQC